MRAAGEPLGVSVDAPDLDAILDAHPLARRAASAVAAAEAASAHEHRSRFPRLGVQLSDWIHRGNDAHDVRVFLTMDLPLFDEPRITRAETAETQSTAERDATHVRIRSAVVAAHEDYLAIAERCRAQSEQIVPMAREGAELAADGYAEGSVDLTTTLAAAQALADAERALALCTAERARAAARLDHAEGRTDAWR